MSSSCFDFKTFFSKFESSACFKTSVITIIKSLSKRDFSNDIARKDDKIALEKHEKLDLVTEF